MAERHTIAFINDEIRAPLAETVAFAHANEITALEVRSIEGRNFLALAPAEQKQAARAIRDGGLEVVGLASPLLKWAAPGRTASDRGDQFGFDLGGRPLGEIARLTAEAAHTLGTWNIRIFSYLTHDSFSLDDLSPAFDELLRVAESENLTLHVENEPVCNVRDEVTLLGLMQAYRHPRLKALLDIGNLYAVGIQPTTASLAAVMPFVDFMHFKDVSTVGRRHVVALGEGEIPFPEFMASCFEAASGRSLILSVETHVADDPAGATQRSLAHLKQLAATAQA